MSMNAVSEMIAAGAKVVDVRTRDEFEDESYPGAINVPLGLLQAKMQDLGPKDAPFVLYCASGARSAQASSVRTRVDVITQ